jgi:hypothetical protein
MLHYAQRYGEEGLPIFPIDIETGKPRIKWGTQASCGLATAQFWLQRWPNSVWGIAVPARYIVVDIDI